jgi:hypothetical protein
MQLAHCFVKHQGNHYHAIKRINVSPAEILVLKKIHGADAITGVQYAGDSERSDADEVENLNRIYGGKEETQAHVANLFPGAAPKLPQTLAEVGYDLKIEPKPVAGEQDEDEIIRPPRKTLSAKAAQALA